MDSKNLSKDTIAFLLTTYKSIPNEEAKANFIQKAEKNLNVKPGQLLSRIKLEMVWEDFRSNGVDSEYDPDNETEGPQKAVGEAVNVEGNVKAMEGSSSEDRSNTMSKLIQLLRDGEKLDVLLDLLNKPEVSYCKYCKSLGLSSSLYLSHNMNSRNGNIICPRWNTYRYAFFINSARRNTSGEKLHE